LQSLFEPRDYRQSPDRHRKKRHCRQSGSYHRRLLRLLRKRPYRENHPDNTFYTQVTPEDAEDIITEHIIGDSKHMDFYRKQLRIALRNAALSTRRISRNTEKHLDTPIDFDNLLTAGSMMVSGGMIVMDDPSACPS